MGSPLKNRAFSRYVKSGKWRDLNSCVPKFENAIAILHECYKQKFARLCRVYIYKKEDLYMGIDLRDFTNNYERSIGTLTDNEVDDFPSMHCSRFNKRQTLRKAASMSSYY